MSEEIEILVENHGCDDTTESIMRVNQQELETIIKFCKINNKNSTYHCKPKIEVYRKFERIKYDPDDEESDGYYNYDESDNLVKFEEENQC